uniref:Putative ovule protein n=1 Tax=Solanum chacoense TaxID=4108 RepID=A0A0V0GXN2_SOLCH
MFCEFYLIVTSGHGFKLWKQPLAKMWGKVAYNKPLWFSLFPYPAHSGGFSVRGCPLGLSHCDYRNV